MERKAISTNIRLNLNRPEDRQAWAYLQNMDRKKYRSYSRAVVAAINDYFSRQEHQDQSSCMDSAEKEAVFLQKILDTIREGLRSSGTGLPAQPRAAPPAQASMSNDDLNVAMDFIKSL